MTSEVKNAIHGENVAIYVIYYNEMLYIICYINKYYAYISKSLDSILPERSMMLLYFIHIPYHKSKSPSFYIYVYMQ